METNQFKTKLEQGNLHLEVAKNELNRPAEDVVPFSVCRSTRYSISNYLQGYLLKDKIKFHEEDSVETLLEKCRAIDGKFNTLDLSTITFENDDEYSAEFDEMINCIDLAESAKQLVGE